LLGRLTQRRPGRPGVRGVDDPTGEARLARVPPQALAAPDEQQVRVIGPVRARGEQDEDG